MSDQADKTGFRWMHLTTATSRTNAPHDGAAGDVPDFVMSPIAVSKMATTGLLLMLKQPTTSAPATSVAAGFDVVMWLRDPATLRWAAFGTVTIAYDQLFVTYDVDASEIFFQIVLASISVDGAIDFGIAEQ